MALPDASVARKEAGHYVPSSRTTTDWMGTRRDRTSTTTNGGANALTPGTLYISCPWAHAIGPIQSSSTILINNSRTKEVNWLQATLKNLSTKSQIYN